MGIEIKKTIAWPIETGPVAFEQVRSELFDKEKPRALSPQRKEAISRMEFVKYPMNEHSQLLVDWFRKNAREYLGRIRGALVFDHFCCSNSALRSLADEYGAEAYIGSDLLHVRNTFSPGTRGTPHEVFIQGDALNIVSKLRGGLYGLITLSGVDGSGVLDPKPLERKTEDPKAPKESSFPGIPNFGQQIAAILGQGVVQEVPKESETIINGTITPLSAEAVHREYLDGIVEEAERMLHVGGLFVFGKNAGVDQKILLEAALRSNLKRVEVKDPSQEFALFEKVSD